jgi:hypothetical protein
MFYECQLRNRFEELLLGEIRTEITRLLELIWSGRGKGTLPAELYNQKYYDQVLAEREIISNRVSAKWQEYQALREGLEKIKRQRRLTAQKTEEMHQVYQESQTAKEELEVFDRRHNNTDYDRMEGELKRRMKAEGEWLQSLSLTAEYMTPEEVAIMASEHFEDNVYSFQRQVVVDVKNVRQFQTSDSNGLGNRSCRREYCKSFPQFYIDRLYWLAIFRNNHCTSFAKCLGHQIFQQINSQKQL